jgi:hypothetical protein
MFGWLAVHPVALCRRAAVPPAQRRWLRVSPLQLAEHLPRLGHVLYLADARPLAAMDEPPPGWLVEQCELAPVLHTHWLVAAGVVGDDGPREWLECVDRHGNACARLHLLPDTDYLAWDALLAAGIPTPAPTSLRAPRPFRPAGACVTRFHRRHLAGLVALGRAPCAPVSTLGRDVAQRIAQAEAVALQLPVAG